MNKVRLLIGILSIAVLLSGCINILEGDSSTQIEKSDSPVYDDTTQIDELNASIESIDTSGSPLYNDSVSVSMLYSISSSHNITNASVGFTDYMGTVSVNNTINSTQIRLNVTLTEESEEIGDKFGSELGLHLSSQKIKVNTSEGEGILTEELSFKNVYSKPFYVTLSKGNMYLTRKKLQETRIDTQGVNTTIYANSKSGNIIPTEQKIQHASSVVDATLTADKFDSRQVYVSTWRHEQTTPAFVLNRNTDSQQFVYYHRTSIYIDTPTLYHEFIHNYQLYNTTSQTKWIIEGFAEYGGSVFASKQSDENLVRDEIAMNTSNSSYLTNPNTWSDLTHYKIGGQLAYKIDREIRSQSDYTIFDLMNNLVKYDEVDKTVFYSELENLTTERFVSEVQNDANSKQFYIPKEQIKVSHIDEDSD